MPQGYIITCTLLTVDIHFCRFLFVCFDFMLWFQIIPRTTHRQPSVDADTPVVVKGPCEIDLYTDVLRIMKNSSVLIGGVLDDSSSSCLSSRVGWSCHLHQTWQTCLILDIDNVAIHCILWRFWGQAPQQCNVRYMLTEWWWFQGACSSSSRVQIAQGAVQRNSGATPLPS